eukprot:6823650-Ditylum_brightwellii.AAC.1
MKLRFQQAVKAQIQQTQKDMESPNSFVQFLPHEILAQAVQEAKEELLKGNPERDKPWQGIMHRLKYLLTEQKKTNADFKTLTQPFYKASNVRKTLGSNT